MLDKVTLNKLHELHLSGMAAALVRQQEERVEDIPFEDRFALLVEAEWLEKKNRRIGRLVSQASFRFPATIENIEWQGKHGITRADVLRLAEGSWIHKKQNLVLSGPTGVGKTYIANALGRHACGQGIAVRYFRVTDLFLKIADSQLENRYRSFRNKIAVTPFLILDDWGLHKFSLEETQELLELFEQRYDRSSTLICGQIPPTAWHDLFPDPTLADAILDRVIHNTIKYAIAGESMRKVLAERAESLEKNITRLRRTCRSAAPLLPHAACLHLPRTWGILSSERQLFKCCRINVQIIPDPSFKCAGFCITRLFSCSISIKPLIISITSSKISLGNFSIGA
jgi:DNA replication protein DnaC